MFLRKTSTLSTLAPTAMHLCSTLQEPAIHVKSVVNNLGTSIDKNKRREHVGIIINRV